MQTLSTAQRVVAGTAVALLVELGRGGATIHYRRRYEAGSYTDARLQGYEASEEVRAAIDAGAPIIDTRPMAFRDACDYALKGPLLDASDGAEPDALFGEPTPGLGLDGCGYTSLQRAPLVVLARLAQARGAFVRNVEGI